mmetsp:Transcript_1396/g.2882  ORF Transcript_1396/g.2882 Transcript_1396/m.2882 type:complete len:377 (-) Transcript_1396:223-1353(-)
MAVYVLSTTTLGTRPQIPHVIGTRLLAGSIISKASCRLSTSCTPSSARSSSISYFNNMNRRRGVSRGSPLQSLQKMDVPMTDVDPFRSTELPCLLFTPDEVFLPGSRKVLHLYEARFLALLDESMYRTGGFFAHVVFHPNVNGGEESLQLDRVATLCRLERVQRQEVGARVEVVAEARLQLVDVTRVSPYIKGVFKQVRTFANDTLYKPSEAEVLVVANLVTELRSMINDLQLLTGRLQMRNESSAGQRVDESMLWQQWGHTEISNLNRSLKWVESPVVDLSAMKCPQSMVQGECASDTTHHEVTSLEVAERLSFAILQAAPASTDSDIRRLVQARTDAMALEGGLLARLENARDILDEQVKVLCAKVAILSLGPQ